MSDEKTRSSVEAARDTSAPVLPTVNPNVQAPQKPSDKLHPAIYVAAWIALSSSVIVFNKWILSSKKFEFPIFLTTWHLVFATLMTQLMARFTTILDSRKQVPMTGRVYLRAIVPIGIFFSLSLICGNQTYLYLSVSFIQMLKATTPVVVLLLSWSMGVSKADMKTLANVSIIVLGVIIASIGEIKFVMIGFLFQVAGLVFEAVRLLMVQRLLSSDEFKMDPLVSLYYYAPACAIINGAVWLFYEMPRMSVDDVYRVGGFTLLLNALVAFMLNVSVVFLIGRTSVLVLTLSGVLKDILLVFASMIIFGDPVTLLQAFGYGIALVGLMFYKLGAQKMKELVGQGGMAWAEMGATRPVTRKLLIFAIAALTVFVLLGGLAPRIAPESTKKLYDGIGTYVADKAV